MVGIDGYCIDLGWLGVIYFLYYLSLLGWVWWVDFDFGGVDVICVGDLLYYVEMGWIVGFWYGYLYVMCVYVIGVFVYGYGWGIGL